MNNEDKAKQLYYKYDDAKCCGSPMASGSVAFNAAMEMTQWKDEQLKQIQEREIKTCNNYIEKHPNNKLMLKYHLGRLSLCDELLGTDSKDKIDMAFATMD